MKLTSITAIATNALNHNKYTTTSTGTSAGIKSTKATSRGISSPLSRSIDKHQKKNRLVFVTRHSSSSNNNFWRKIEMVSLRTSARKSQSQERDDPFGSPLVSPRATTRSMTATPKKTPAKSPTRKRVVAKSTKKDKMESVDIPAPVHYHMDISVSSQPWWSLVLRACLSIIFGCLCMFDPLDSVYSVALFFAGFVFVDGAITMWYAVKGMLNKTLKLSPGFFRLIAGVLGIGYGIAAALTKLETEAVIFSRLVASLIILRGVGEILGAIVLSRLPDVVDNGLLLFPIGKYQLITIAIIGVIEIGWGAVVLGATPAMEVLTIGSLIGIYAFYNAMTLFYNAWAARKIARILGDVSGTLSLDYIYKTE
mmetsp:Transcript_180/g.377  ORF Transcript_180/g.377 Transcript_180/m.377 type:complete len:367 (-) Transcript_180:165-1265(-)